MSISEAIALDDFLRVDIRVGTIVAAEAFPEARKPAIRLTIDFGPEIGTKRSSAQITVHYALDDLIGRQVAAVVNFPPRQIGPMMSDVLCLGFPDAAGTVVLVAPDVPVPNGGAIVLIPYPVRLFDACSNRSLDRPGVATMRWSSARISAPRPSS